MRWLPLFSATLLLGVACASPGAPPPSSPSAILPLETEPAAEITVWPTYTPEPTWTLIPPQPTPTNWRLVPNAEVNYPAPDVILTTLEGDTFKLSDLRGKVVLIDFWGIGCPGCTETFRGMERAYQAYGSEDVAIIGINSFDTPDEIRQEAARLGATFPMVSDPEGAIFLDSFGGVLVPTFVFIDRQGLIQIVIVDRVPSHYLESLLASLL